MRFSWLNAVLPCDRLFDQRLARVARPHPLAVLLYRSVIVLAIVPAAIVLAVGLFGEPTEPSTAKPTFDHLLMFHLRKMTTRKQVVQFLGRPRERFLSDPLLPGAGISRDRDGKFLVWDRWWDPKDPKRWIAVRYNANSPEETIYGTCTSGLD